MKKTATEKQKILIVYAGTIGDTLIALPSISKLHEKYKDAELDLFNAPLIKNHVHDQLFENTNYFRKKFFILTAGNFIQKAIIRFKILNLLRQEHYDKVIYLSFRIRKIEWVVFRLLGIREIIGCKKNPPPTQSIYAHYADSLRPLGITFKPSELVLRLSFSDKECCNAQSWFDSLNIPQDFRPIAISIGGKQKACHWPIDNYIQLIKRIYSNNKLFPIIVGGKGDLGNAEKIMAESGIGAFSGNSGLTLRETIKMLEYCLFYVGNDTGGIHMAASAGLPCIGIYSARIRGKVWHPPGNQHLILQKKISCEGCGLTSCRFGYPARCLEIISVDEVYGAVQEMMRRIDSPQ